MTAPRRPRSARLLVGSTPSRTAKVQSAGQRLSRFLANWRWYFVFGLFRAACSSSAPSWSWSCVVWARRRGALAVGLIVVPGGEEVAGDLDALAAELLLFGHPFAVGGEVAEQVRPTELPLGRVEVVVAAPAVGADDPGEALAEQCPGLEGVAAGGDPEHGRLTGQGAPERPAGAGGLPARLVDVDDRRRLDLLLEPRVGRGERLAGRVDDRVDRAGRQLEPEQLPGQLARVAARDTVSDRERHHRRLQPGPERRAWHLVGKLGPGRAGALGAADSVQPVLGHTHRDRRQLRDLLPPRLHRVNAASRVEHVRAHAAPLGPMLDALVDLRGRKQPPVPALVPGLASPLAAGAWPAWPRRCRGRILRGRQRRVARAATEPPLKLGDASLQPPVRLDELADPHQQRHRRLPVAVEDRLRLGPLHAGRVRRAEPGPFLLQNHKNPLTSALARRSLRGEVNAYGFPFSRPYKPDSPPPQVVSSLN